MWHIVSLHAAICDRLGLLCAAQVAYYHRAVARQQQQQQQWLQKRRQENAQRRLAGEEPLPEEDPVLFKPVPEPSPLEGFLINNQVHALFFAMLQCVHCQGISGQLWAREYHIPCNVVFMARQPNPP